MSVFTVLQRVVVLNYSAHFTDVVFLCVFFFFFQAEDGIRDHCVTGVQTCALPICGRSSRPAARAARSSRSAARPGVGRWRAAPVLGTQAVAAAGGSPHRATGSRRSEERRVGKEGRSRWSPYH